MSGRLSAMVALRDWKPYDAGALTATASVRGADVQDVLALAGNQAAGHRNISASAQVTGTVGTPLIKADVSAAKAPFTVSRSIALRPTWITAAVLSPSQTRN